MYLFFDTETTGFPRSWKAPVTDLDNWPRIVQIAWILTDEAGAEIEAADYIVKPDGFTIPEAATRIHRISTERALQEGVSLNEALTKFAGAFEKSRLLIAHNINFDRPIVASELFRLEMPQNIFEKPSFCTQMQTTDFCKLPSRYRGYKWPKLEELHRILFDSNFEDGHDAYVDVKACLKCFFELKNRGIIAIPDIISA